jgi:DNA adenine methylase
MQETKPPISWFGGKFYIARDIVNMIPKHTAYCEPFGGSGCVLFFKEPSKVEIYNDLNSWLVNLYRVIRNQPQELLDRLEFLPYSRQEYHQGLKLYQELRDTEHTLSDVEKAALFFLVVRSSFNAKVGSSFSYSAVSSKGSSWRNSMELIFPAHQRLREVIIENIPFYECFSRYDGVETLFYLDPPYPAGTRVSSNDYEFEMTDDDHEEFILKCMDLEGMCIISSYHNSIYDGLLINDNESDNQWHYKDIDVCSHATSITEFNKLDEKPRRTEVLYWNSAVENRKSQMVLF